MSVRTILMTISLLLAGVATSTAQSIEQIKELIEQGQYKQAAMRLRPLADGGDAEAQYLAAMLFLEGKGVTGNPQQAFKYAKMAAAHPKHIALSLTSEFKEYIYPVKGKMLVSWMYYTGVGVNKNDDMAISYAKKLTPEYQIEAAKLLLGKDVYYTLADDWSYPTKNEHLAYYFYKFASQIPESYKEYYELLPMLTALSELSKMCYEGIGTEKDTVQAIKYASMMDNEVFHKEVRNFIGEKYLELAQYYKERNDTMFFRVLAAKAGLEETLDWHRDKELQMKKELIQCYLNGVGCVKDSLAALRLINSQPDMRKEYLDASSPKLDVYINAILSSKNGESLATFCDETDNEDLLEALLKKYSNTQDAKEQQNIFQEWLHQAEEGSPSAMWMVSNFYEKGIGTEADITKSRELAQKAVDKGKNKGIWWARNEYMKCKPLQAGEAYNGKIVVESEVTTGGGYTYKNGKKAKEYKYVSIYTYDIAIKEFKAKEVKDGYKKINDPICREIADFDFGHYITRLKIYAAARKKMGQPMPEGKYWFSNGPGKDREVALLTINSDGVITATTSMKDLSKDEKEQPHYFLVQKHYVPDIKSGEPLEYW